MRASIFLINLSKAQSGWAFRGLKHRWNSLTSLRTARTKRDDARDVQLTLPLSETSKRPSSFSTSFKVTWFEAKGNRVKPFKEDFDPYTLPDGHPASALQMTGKAITRWITGRRADKANAGFYLGKV